MSNLTSSSNLTASKQAQNYTRLNDPDLTHAIAHINEEHIDELLELFQAHTSIPTAEKNKVSIKLHDIYAEGLTLKTTPKQSKNQQDSVTEKEILDQKHNEQIFFIPFQSPIENLDELQIQYIYLRQKADKKLGKKTIKLTKQIFSVEDSYKVSEHMLRIVLSLPNQQTVANISPSPVPNIAPNAANQMPTQEAGYAYLFDLAHNLEARPDLIAQIDKPRPHCYYTLRKAWTTDTGTQAWVDVFLHGDTSGGVWASSLQAGDTIMSKREFPEKIEHLREGQVLLIADETSMPTVARLLELWQNPTPPLIVCITQDEADQTYLANVETKHTIKDKVTILPLVTGEVNSGKTLAHTIDKLLEDYLTSHHINIDKVWGGLEAATAKTLRGLLKQRLSLERTDVVVKVYWREDK